MKQNPGWIDSWLYPSYVVYISIAIHVFNCFLYLGLAYKFLAIYLCGEPEKACDLFIEGFKKKVFREVFQEEICDESMGGEEDQEARNTQHLDYIMKVRLYNIVS